MNYGAIVFCNGKLLSKHEIENMQDMVGWTDTEENTDYNNLPLRLNNNYFTYIGDKNVVVAFYKESIKCIEYVTPEYCITNIWQFNCEKKIPCKYSYYIKDSKATIKHKHQYFVFKWKYDNCKYKVFFGKDVNLENYKKYHKIALTK